MLVCLIKKSSRFLYKGSQVKKLRVIVMERIIGSGMRDCVY